MDTKEKFETRRLKYLDNLDDYELHDNEPDIRGWDVYSQSGRKIGEVENLVVDTDAETIRYAVVELDDDLYSERDKDQSFFERISESVRDFFSDNDDRHILIPVGRLQLNADQDRLITTGLQGSQYANAPRYRYNRNSFFQPRYEVAVVQFCTLPDDNDYDTYRDEKYEEKDFTDVETIRDRSFYNTDLFSREHYFRHSRNANTTRAASVDTGALKV